MQHLDPSLRQLSMGQQNSQARQATDSDPSVSRLLSYTQQGNPANQQQHQARQRSAVGHPATSTVVANTNGGIGSDKSSPATYSNSSVLGNITNSTHNPVPFEEINQHLYQHPQSISSLNIPSTYNSSYPSQNQLPSPLDQTTTPTTTNTGTGTPSPQSQNNGHHIVHPHPYARQHRSNTYEQDRNSSVDEDRSSSNPQVIVFASPNGERRRTLSNNMGYPSRETEPRGRDRSRERDSRKGDRGSLDEHYRGATSGIPSLHARRTHSEDNPNGQRYPDGFPVFDDDPYEDDSSDRGSVLRGRRTGSDSRQRFPQHASQSESILRSPHTQSSSISQGFDSSAINGGRAGLDLLVNDARHRHRATSVTAAAKRDVQTMVDHIDQYTLPPIRLPPSSARLRSTSPSSPGLISTLGYVNGNPQDMGLHIPKGLFDKLIRCVSESPSSAKAIGR